MADTKRTIGEMCQQSALRIKDKWRITLACSHWLLDYAFPGMHTWHLLRFAPFFADGRAIFLRWLHEILALCVLFSSLQYFSKK
jgi:hypothetical protein